MSYLKISTRRAQSSPKIRDFQQPLTKRSTDRKRSTKRSMSGRYTRAQGGFTPGEEQNLFKTPPTTVRRRQRSTEPGSLKRPSPGSPTPQSRFMPGPPLDQSDSLSTSTFDDLDSQFSFEFAPKPKFSMITTSQPGGSIDQGDDESHNDHQNNPLKLNVNKQIELAKLRVQQLQLKLQIKRLAASLNFNLNSSQKMSTLLIQFI